MSVDPNKPAKNLIGKTLDDGWEVKEKIVKAGELGEKSFSETYLVVKNGKTALLKALDFSIALEDDNPPVALIRLSKAYEFEKELLDLCNDHRFSRIVKILSKGNIPAQPGSIIPVPYFILEYAKDDLKSQIDIDSRFNTVWLFRILHNVSVGLTQLHDQGIAHTNARPEHIKSFDKNLQKLSELGNADKKGIVSPYKDFITTEDPAYMTPETLYGYEEAEWIYKSQATDAYHLGNLIFFLFTQTNVNTWVNFYLDESHRHDKWHGTYAEVLPYVIDAYDKAIYHFTAFVEDGTLKDSLEVALRQLCHPDPRRRGHPKNIESIGSSLSLERYISLFDRMARLAEVKLIS